MAAGGDRGASLDSSMMLARTRAASNMLDEGLYMSALMELNSMLHSSDHPVTSTWIMYGINDTCWKLARKLAEEDCAMIRTANINEDLKEKLYWAIAHCRNRPTTRRVYPSSSLSIFILQPQR
jgi:lysophospholipase L1-like esterase